MIQEPHFWEKKKKKWYWDNKIIHMGEKTLDPYLTPF